MLIRPPRQYFVHTSTSNVPLMLNYPQDILRHIPSTEKEKGFLFRRLDICITFILPR